MKKTKVKMVVSIAGLAEPIYDLEEFSSKPGEEIEIHPELARHWIAAGHAIAINNGSPIEPETTSIEPTEHAVLPSPRPRGKPKKEIGE
jgi:hypothetical protein